MPARTIDYIFRVASDNVSDRFRALEREEENFRRRVGQPLMPPPLAPRSYAPASAPSGTVPPLRPPPQECPAPVNGETDDQFARRTAPRQPADTGGSRRRGAGDGAAAAVGFREGFRNALSAKSGPGDLVGEGMGLVSSKFAQAFSVIGAGYAIKRGLDDLGAFEDQISTLAFKLGEPVASLQKTKKELLGLSLTRGIRQDATELAGAMNVLAGADFSKADSFAITSASAKGASANLADVGTVTMGLMAVMKGFRLEGSKAEETLSKMMKASDLGVVEMEDLASSMTSLTGPAQQSGASLETVLALLETLSVSGVSNAAEASNSIARMLTRFTAADFRATAKFGYKIDVADDKGNMKKPLEILELIAAKYKSLGSDVKRNDFIDKLSGGNILVAKSLVPLINNLGVVQKQLDTLNQTDATLLNERFAESSKRLSAQMEHMGKTLKVVAMDFASLFIPFVDALDSEFPEGEAAGSLADHIRGVIKIAANTVAKDGWGGYLWKAIFKDPLLHFHDADHRKERENQRKDGGMWDYASMAARPGDFLSNLLLDKLSAALEKSGSASTDNSSPDPEHPRQKSKTDMAIPAMLNTLRDPLLEIQVRDYSKVPPPVVHVHLDVKNNIDKDGRSRTEVTQRAATRYPIPAGGH